MGVAVGVIVGVLVGVAVGVIAGVLVGVAVAVSVLVRPVHAREGRDTGPGHGVCVGADAAGEVIADRLDEV